MAVTSTYREPVDETMVAMRWNSKGTTETGFRRKCFAKVDWPHLIAIRDGEEFEIEFDGVYEGKRVRDAELVKILEARANIAASRTAPRKPHQNPSA